MELLGILWVSNLVKDFRIIDDTLWKAVQRRIKEAQPINGQASMIVRQYRHPLSGLLKCGLCSASFVIADSYNYACASHRDGGTSACANALRVRRADVEQAIFDGVADHLLKPEWLEEFSRWFRQQLEVGRKSQAATEASSCKRLNAVEREVNNITDAIVLGRSALRRRRMRRATGGRTSRLTRGANVQVAASWTVLQFQSSTLWQRP